MPTGGYERVVASAYCVGPRWVGQRSSRGDCVGRALKRLSLRRRCDGGTALEREILHVNTDDFYASVLRLRDATLRGKAIIVAGTSARAVVFSASYEARSEGVVRGMALSAARGLCRRALIVPPDWALFRRASAVVFGVLGRYSPLVEVSSLDEGYVDYTGCEKLFGPPLEAGRRMKLEISRETGLDVSLGIASNKLVSHVASRFAKRANIVDVYCGYERSFLAPLPVERFPLVGERRAPFLRELGIRVVGDIALFAREILVACFGSWGERLHRGALGKDSTPVKARPVSDERFIVEETLEPDRVDTHFLDAVLYRLAEKLGERLRAERSLAGALELEIRYSDGFIARGVGKPGKPAAEDCRLYEAASKVLSRIYVRRVRVRKIVLSGRRIEPMPLQYDLFAGGAESVERLHRLYAALDGLRAAYPGRVAPAFGRALAAIAPARPGKHGIF